VGIFFDPPYTGTINSTIKLMNHQLLEETAQALVREGHGILAADNSSKSTLRQFTSVGIESTPESRQAYCAMLVTAPQAANVLSGVILYEETFYQHVGQQTFPEYLQSVGILPGIKLDQGLQDLPGFPDEKITAGLDSLPERAAQFAKDGARFVKWRNVIKIGEGIPTDECIGANTYILARYARICQDNNMVPIVEPEVLLEGNHTAEQCEHVTRRVYEILFQTLRAFRVHLPGTVMKTAMVLPGSSCDTPYNPDEIAERTIRVLDLYVPKELGGVVFLSGGQTTDQSLINLNRINQRAKNVLAFGVTFSYLRSLQDQALHQWAKDQSDKASPQAILDGLLLQAAAARNGVLDESGLDGNGEQVKKAQEY
jgi:fructose-bisphosphate aldolase, class I